MPAAALTEVGLDLGRLFRRPRTVYFEDIRELNAARGRLQVCCHDGRTLRLREQDDAARALRRVMEPVCDRLSRVDGMDAARRELVAVGTAAGFSAPLAVDLLLGVAATLDASDVHLRPEGDDYALAARCQGVLHSLGTWPLARARRAIVRLKVLTGVHVHRSDIVQEARLDSDSDHVRLSFVPCLGGESVSLRRFETRARPRKVSQLGWSKETQASVLQLVESGATGVVALVGPTASGKTTSMYALLQAYKDADATLRCVTIEDPVERVLPFAVQMDASRGEDVGALLAAALRQDARLLAVGEIRDARTASLAFEAGLTGHHVVTTVHAGSVRDALQRWREQGMEPSVLAQALAAVVTQRLKHATCTECAGAAGCIACGGSGTLVSAVAELWRPPVADTWPELLASTDLTTLAATELR